jgi:hypothetical protein
MSPYPWAAEVVEMMEEQWEVREAIVNE